MTMRESGPSVDQLGHNPDCTRNRCRACLGYGVVVTGGPFYRACKGEEAEGWLVVEAMSRVAAELDALPWWRLREHHAKRRIHDQLVNRYREIVPMPESPYDNHNQEDMMETTTLRQDLNVRLDGVQGTLIVAAEDGESGKVIWITTEANGDNEGGVSIGVDPADLRAAISFVLGEAMDGCPCVGTPEQAECPHA